MTCITALGNSDSLSLECTWVHWCNMCQKLLWCDGSECSTLENVGNWLQSAVYYKKMTYTEKCYYLGNKKNACKAFLTFADVRCYKCECIPCPMISQVMNPANQTLCSRLCKYLLLDKAFHMRYYNFVTETHHSKSFSFSGCHYFHSSVKWSYCFLFILSPFFNIFTYIFSSRCEDFEAVQSWGKLWLAAFLRHSDGLRLPLLPSPQVDRGQCSVFWVTGLAVIVV